MCVAKAIKVQANPLLNRINNPHLYIEQYKYNEEDGFEAINGTENK